MTLKRSILLINLGTPDKAEPKAVKRYLKQFLMDARVIDLPWFVRWPLVRGIIVPFRYRKSSEAYQKIWGNNSPLLQNTQALTEALAKLLPDDQVAFAMLYANPSIESVIEQLVPCRELIVIPLFPQYASASTGSAIAEFLSQQAKKWNIPKLVIHNQFYDCSGFIEAYSDLISETLPDMSAIDHILFSYHGLPERHINKSQCKTACDRQGACPTIGSENHYCYRAQCYHTTTALAASLDLPDKKYTTVFQSRLGRTPWIKPYTDEVLSQLRANQVERLAVVCPSFVSDCLETLEEVNIRLRAQWLSLGGKSFTMVPCLNAHSAWVRALVNFILNK